MTAPNNGIVFALEALELQLRRIALALENGPMGATDHRAHAQRCMRCGCTLYLISNPDRCPACNEEL